MEDEIKDLEDELKGCFAKQSSVRSQLLHPLWPGFTRCSQGPCQGQAMIKVGNSLPLSLVSFYAPTPKIFLEVASQIIPVTLNSELCLDVAPRGLSLQA